MDKIVITQAKSAISSNKSQRATLRSLGLRRISAQVQHNATPQIMGQVQKVAHLVRFSVVAAEPAPQAKPTTAPKTAKAAPEKSAKPATKPKSAKPTATKSAKTAPTKGANATAKPKTASKKRTTTKTKK